MALTTAMACKSRSETAAPSVATTAAPATVSGAAIPPSSAEHSTHEFEHDIEAPPLPPGASATALSDARLPRVTKLRVSAHVGTAIILKGNDDWTAIGPRRCTVPQQRVDHALENLSSLTATPIDKPPPGTKFELQIEALMENQHAIHFEIAERQGDTDLARLLTGDVVQLRGLDRKLWTPSPADWCTEP